MSSQVDKPLLDYIGYHCLIPKFNANLYWHPEARKKYKVAIVGERSRKKTKNTFAYKLTHMFHLLPANVKIFTDQHRFEPEMAKDFTLLIGIRPCEGANDILNAATEYGTQFVLVPCTCGGYSNNVLNLIREYPIISDISARPQQYANGKNDTICWIILHNKRTFDINSQ